MGGLFPHEKDAFKTAIRALHESLLEPEPISYEGEDLVPIPAICTGPKHHEWLDGNGNGAIRAPTLRHCCCFYCGRPLKLHPDYKGFKDTETLVRERQAALPTQLSMESLT